MIVSQLLSSATEDDSGSRAELVLTIAPKIAEFGVVQIGLYRAEPDMTGNRNVDASTYSQGERGVIGGGELANAVWEVSVEAVDATEDLRRRAGSGCDCGCACADRVKGDSPIVYAKYFALELLAFIGVVRTVFR